jgi:hypothetical protein
MPALHMDMILHKAEHNLLPSTSFPSRSRTLVQAELMARQMAAQ